MAVVSRTCASLHVSGGDLIPDEITTLLGSAPTVARRKGEPMQTPRPCPPSRTGMWSLSAAKAEGDALDSQIRSILSLVTSDLTVWDKLADRFEMNMFCGVWLDDWNQGTSLSPATMKLLGDRNILLELDIYSDESPAEAKTARQGA